MGAPTYVEGELSLARGGKLFTVKYLPAEGTPLKAVLVFHHGYGEHVGRYTDVFNKLASDGISVYSYDAFSFGRSEPNDDKRGHIEDFMFFVDDLEQYVADVKAQHPGTPLFLAGQSLGGLISTYTVLRNQSQYAGLLLWSAAIDVKRNLALKILAPLSGIAAKLIPMARIAPAVDPNDMSTDPAAVATYLADKNVFVGNVRAKFANQAMHAIDGLRLRCKELTLPLLSVHGTSDNVAPMKAVKRLLEEAQSTDTKMHEFPGSYHELFHGPERDEATLVVRDWIQRLTSSL